MLYDLQELGSLTTIWYPLSDTWDRQTMLDSVKASTPPQRCAISDFPILLFLLLRDGHAVILSSSNILCLQRRALIHVLCTSPEHTARDGHKFQPQQKYHRA